MPRPWPELLDVPFARWRMPPRFHRSGATSVKNVENICCGVFEKADMACGTQAQRRQSSTSTRSTKIARKSENPSITGMSRERGYSKALLKMLEGTGPQPCRHRGPQHPYQTASRSTPAQIPVHLWCASWVSTMWVAAAAGPQVRLGFLPQRRPRPHRATRRNPGRPMWAAPHGARRPGSLGLIPEFIGPLEH